MAGKRHNSLYSPHDNSDCIHTIHMHTDMMKFSNVEPSQLGYRKVQILCEMSRQIKLKKPLKLIITQMLYTVYKMNYP